MTLGNPIGRDLKVDDIKDVPPLPPRPIAPERAPSSLTFCKKFLRAPLITATA
jgi:hypothetical protein